MTKVQSAPSAETIEQALAQHTLCAAFQVTAAAHPERPALRTLGAEREYTWGEYADEVQRIAGGLHALGVRAGDAVALMLAGCSEFHLIDTAAMHIGAAPFSIYFTNPVAQIVPMIENSEARVVFTQPQFARDDRGGRAPEPNRSSTSSSSSPARSTCPPPAATSTSRPRGARSGRTTSPASSTRRARPASRRASSGRTAR